VFVCLFGDKRAEERVRVKLLVQKSKTTPPPPHLTTPTPTPNTQIQQLIKNQLDGRPDCDDVQDALLQATGGRSVPRVFIDGAFIGGGDDTAAKAANGELQALLQKAGVL
jgi:glutaredoxin 3